MCFRIRSWIRFQYAESSMGNCDKSLVGGASKLKRKMRGVAMWNLLNWELSLVLLHHQFRRRATCHSHTRKELLDCNPPSLCNLWLAQHLEATFVSTKESIAWLVIPVQA